MPMLTPSCSRLPSQSRGSVMARLMIYYLNEWVAIYDKDRDFKLSSIRIVQYA